MAENKESKEEMDNNVDEDPSVEYEKQRLSFISDLKRFNSNRGTPFDRIPEIGGYEIDLYHLYQRVTSLGGWQKVNLGELWEDFLEDFGLPGGCVNATQALKNIYFRYLNLYEKVNFLDTFDLQELYHRCWMPIADRNFLRFWFETVDHPRAKPLITWGGQPYTQSEMVGSSVLNLGRDLGTLDSEGQRVLQTEPANRKCGNLQAFVFFKLVVKLIQ
ncbi:AT-rich interactive domain-containing protein 2 [Plakobranchus ocellatus]|uniref:AT-rich interactive domain-containing protein 2 n=1 Tax=Plakobranchus ocellatus TaxID=259542 RepID=A0AAV4BU19_9GAST|nr:AT-rich interactive domain-containing protein 2 [Plakobranchus ocellatus]